MFRTSGLLSCKNTHVITNFRFGSQRPHTIYPSRDSSAQVFLCGSGGLRQGPVCPNASPETADRGLPIQFRQTPFRLRRLWIDFSAVTVRDFQRRDA